MQDTIKKFLQNVGLSEKETEVYLQLLTVEDASVSTLSKLTGINRTTLYPILEDLIQKKLVTQSDKDPKATFAAEPPERLETYIHNKQTQLEEQEKLLEEYVPRMRSVSLQPGEKPVIKVYEGHDGIIEALEDYYESNDQEHEAYLVHSRDLIEAAFSQKELEGIKKKRLNKKIIANAIYTRDAGEYTTDMASKQLRVDAKKYPILCDISIHGDRVRFITLKRNLSAILIKNRDIAETLESLIRLVLDTKNDAKKDRT